jgi:hypothetical protein
MAMRRTKKKRTTHFGLFSWGPSPNGNPNPFVSEDLSSSSF